MYAIETQGLTKFYGKARGVIDLNLKIEEGEIYGFIGPNGAGKSTTIRLLLSLLFPSSGSGRIFDYDIVEDGPKIKQIIGFVPSEIHYYEKMTVKELIEYSRAYCHTIYKKKLNKKKISSEEHHTFNISLLTLIRLQVYDEDDLTLLCKNKKPKI